MRGLLTFNIVDDNKTYNSFPVVMYYDGSEDIVSTLKKETQLLDYIIDDVISLSNITSLKIAFVTYVSDDKMSTKEDVKKDTVSCDSILDYENNERVLDKLQKEALLGMFNTDSLFDINNNLSKPTIVNGVRSKLLEANISKTLVTSVIKKTQSELNEYK